VGAAFRNKQETRVRKELIVLITVRIVDHGTAGAEGDTAKFESDRRSKFFRDHLAPINRYNLARMHYENALYHFDRGNLFRARWAIRESLLISKNDLGSLRLQEEIERAIEGKAMPWTSSGTPLYFNEETQTVDPVPASGAVGPAGTPPVLVPPSAARR